MATIYFRNTSDSGEGSLREAIATAADGDVVAPDPSVFGRGERLTIELKTFLDVSKSLTLDAGSTRPRLRNAKGISLYARGDGESLTVVGWEFVGRVVAHFPNASLSRCFFGGNSETAFLVQGTEGTKLALTDCLGVGARRGGVYAAGKDAALTLLRTTIAGCRESIYVASNATFEAIDSIVDPVGSESGFVAPPPDDLSEYEGALPWEEWNLAPTADSRYATGATTGAGECDLLGVARGRTIDGTELRAVGALEVVAADYYLAEDAPGGDFLDPANWRTTRGGAERPETVGAGVFFLDANARWSGAPPVGASLRLAGRVVATLEEDAALASLELGRDAELALVGADRLVSARAVAFGADATTSSATGNGYFAVPVGIDVSGAAFDGVAVCALGAGLTAFSATSRRPGRAELVWTATDASAAIRLESRRGSTGGWTAVSEYADASKGAFEAAAPSGRTTFRALDGERFWTDDAWTLAGVQFRVVSESAASAAPTHGWEAATQIAATSNMVMVGQGITILARIYDAFDEDSVLLSDGANIESVVYTCGRICNGLFEETVEPVAGHENVAVDVDCVLEALQTSDAWTRDDVGYSFVLTPDARDAPLFEKAGKYQFKVVVTPTTGNPIVFYVPVEVVETSGQET